jgi:hypothetical protein
MKAGLMRRRVRLERPDTLADDFGAPVKSWALVAEVDAAVDAVSGREFFAADRELADATWRLDPARAARHAARAGLARRGRRHGADFRRARRAALARPLGAHARRIVRLIRSLKESAKWQRSNPPHSST